jgi:hypothetical protein
MLGAPFPGFGPVNGGSPSEAVTTISLSDQVDEAEFRNNFVGRRMQNDCFSNFHASSLAWDPGHPLSRVKIN